MPLRCVYTDLDGTMLGKGASLLRDAEGNFSTLAVRALKACHRAEVEVVIQSGRRKAQVYEDARLIGQPSYIYEMGSGLVDGDEEVFLTGSSNRARVGHEQIERAGAPRLLMDTFPQRIEPHAPWHTERLFTHLFRGEVPLDEVAASCSRSTSWTCASSTTGSPLRRSPELIVDEVHTYHLIPCSGEGKGRAVAAHMQPAQFAPRRRDRDRGRARGPRDGRTRWAGSILVSNASTRIRCWQQGPATRERDRHRRADDRRLLRSDRALPSNEVRSAGGAQTRGRRSPLGSGAPFTDGFDLEVHQVAARTRRGRRLPTTA